MKRGGIDSGNNLINAYNKSKTEGKTQVVKEIF